MVLSDSFIQVFDKSTSRGNVCKCSGTWTVKEHEDGATMNRLEVNASGDFLGFDHGLVKGVKDTTTTMSSALEDKDCDGIAFLTDSSAQEHLVFTELKSSFDCQRIAGAFHQITMSFIKMHAWLSLCKDYDLKNLKIHFVTACKCCKDEGQEIGVKHRISQAQQLGKDCFETKFLKSLMEKRQIKVRLSDFADIQRLPFHDSIKEKEITMYLQLTPNHGDSSTSVTLS